MITKEVTQQMRTASKDFNTDFSSSVFSFRPKQNMSKIVTSLSTYLAYLLKHALSVGQVLISKIKILCQVEIQSTRKNTLYGSVAMETLS